MRNPVKLEVKRCIQTKKEQKSIMKQYYQLYFLILPAAVYFLLLNYLPMYGITLAFKEYRFDKGILFSPWTE